MRLHGQHRTAFKGLGFNECEARKIAACEHPVIVKEEILKHASEEFRRAHYLKRQIERVSSVRMLNYSQPYFLGGIASLNYLNILDLKTSCFLKSMGLARGAIKQAAHLLVTCAIELRAAEMYPIYEKCLRASGSRVKVNSILLEEKEHLNEMVEGLGKLPQDLCTQKRYVQLREGFAKTG